MRKFSSTPKTTKKPTAPAKPKPAQIATREDPPKPKTAATPTQPAKSGPLVQIDTIISSHARQQLDELLDATITAGEYRFSSRNHILRTALQAHIAGQLGQLVDRGEGNRVRICVKLHPDEVKHFRSFPRGRRAEVLERILLTFLDTLPNISSA